MTQAIAGLKARVYLKDEAGATKTVLGEVKSATITVNQGEIDVTTLASAGWAETIGGLKDWTCDFEGFMVPDNAQQQQLFDSLIGGEVINIDFFPEDLAGKKGYNGDAIVTSWEVGAVPDDVVSLNVSCKGTGALTSITKAPAV